MSNNNTIGGLASIILPCWNQLEFTRHCIAALRQHTRPPWELIVIDNGSTDGTDSYLASVQDAAAVPVTVIGNQSNRGFPAAINQGLQVARGEYLVLLNNDVVVTSAWLEQLIALANAGAQVTAQAAEFAGLEKERANLRVIDFDEESAGEDHRLGGAPPPQSDRGLGAVPPPPLAPPSQGGEVAACATPRIGLVGPMSNYAAPPQLVSDVPYRDMCEMRHFARRWRDEHRGQWFTVHKLSGFCLLMKREVYDKIGGLDERFGIGFFDDDDLAERARRARFDLAIAHDLFVHHFGSRTFLGSGIDAEKLLDDNARRFAAKWGLNGTNGKRVALRPWQGPRDARTDDAHVGRAFQPDARTEGANVGQAFQSDTVSHADPTDGVRPESLTYAGRPKVSLTMIVRDEQENLPRCLASVQGLFDELVVVDTGSTDRTIEIARSFGALVFDFVWVDDFAAARNAALARATGDYAFWLDADDVVDPPQRPKLEAILKGLRRGEEAGHVVRCSCDPGPNDIGGETVVDHIRLFPLREDIRWTYRVHEQILPALNRAHVPVRWTDLIVRHTGYADPVLRARKLVRDHGILVEELHDRPNEPFILFNLGQIAVERRQWTNALDLLRHSLADSAPTDSIVRKLYALIARVQQMMGGTNEALCTCAEGLNLDPEDGELWFRKAVIHRYRGESTAAEECWRRILTLHRPDKFCSFDQGIYGHLTRRNLAMLAAERGDYAEAAGLWREVLVECPEDKEALAKLQGLGERKEQPQR